MGDWEKYGNDVTAVGTTFISTTRRYYYCANPKCKTGYTTKAMINNGALNAKVKAL
ncbi:hypothetical protein D3C75_1206500 [compost metagenome]